MISAPNRLPLLSGNNGLVTIVFLLLVFQLTACELFTKVQPGKDATGGKDVLDPIQGTRVYDPETGTYIVVKTAPTQPMDTVKWKEISMTASPPITSEGVFVDREPSNPVVTTVDPATGSSKLETYNVAIVLPFQTDKFTAQGQVPANSSWALNFYSGAKMALDELRAEGGPNLNVAVLDTKATESGMMELTRRNEFTSAHLIIGPYRRETVRIAADAAKRNNSVLVSPYNATENIVDNNPNYIQVNPSFSTHCDALLSEARHRFRPDQIVLVCRGRDVELERLKYFQDAHKRMQLQSFSRDTAALREFVIADAADSSAFRINVQPLVQNRDTLAIIIPSWSSESFINALLQQLHVAKSGYSHFTVYGMPQWIEYERVSHQYYESLNLHITTSSHVDREQWAVRDFQKSYFTRYGAMPAPESYLGYDVTAYYVRMLRKYGTRFQYAIIDDAGQGLHTRFEVRPIAMPNASNREFPQVKQFENKYVNLLRFEDLRFVKVN